MKKYAIILFSFITTSLAAQDGGNTTLSAGYYGDVFVHPGAKISIEKDLNSWDKAKKGTINRKSLRLGADLTYYYHSGQHHALMIGPSFSFRRTPENGKFMQVKISGGWHRSLLDASTFEISKDEEIRQIKAHGQSTFYQSLSFLFGKQISERIGWYSEVGLNGRFPYNHSYLTGIHLGLGIQYKIKS